MILDFNTLGHEVRLNRVEKMRSQQQSRQAETAAAPVAGGLLQRKCACGKNNAGGGECGKCADGEKRVQRRAAREGEVSHGASASGAVGDVLRSHGSPLDASTRSFMESRFGQDFSGVRVHTDARAHESARAVNALAYTVGSRIAFGAGQYAPQTDAGRRLLAHELTHVVQQRGAHAQLQSLSVEEESSPAEAEADRMSRDIAAGRPAAPVRETMRAGRLGRAPDPDPKSAAAPPANAPANAPAGGAAPAQSPARPQGLRIDVLGADLSVDGFLARSAAQALGADIRVTSLEDMITQLEQKAGSSTGKCVEHLSIWNHGSPGGQMVAGSDAITPKGGKPYKLPYSGLTTEWLLSQGNQGALNRLRNVFCCGATMKWLGCGTAGVEAEGGLRTEAEQASSKLRYRQHGDRYKDAQDAAEHGASLMGATFGNLNTQSWADATCTTVEADTDFTYFTPKDPKKLYYAGHGGKFVSYPPHDPALCLCDPATGRPKSKWTVAEGKRFIREKEEAATGGGGDYLWHLYLETFRSVWKQRKRPEVKPDVIAAMRRLLLEAAAKIKVPGGLPVGDVRPWTNVESVDPNWAAVTSPHLIFCFPDNCWRWIMVNQNAFQTTPAHTQQTLEHELLHAADMWKAAQDFKRDNGDPPGSAGDRCKPVDGGTYKNWTDDWGKYVNKFVAFYESKTPAQRHVDIYAESAKPHWAKLTMKEKVTWFGGMLQNVPPDLPAAKTFEAEQIILNLFKNPRPEELALRQELAAVLSRVAAETILGTSGQKVDEGKGRTLLTHFSPVWQLRPEQRSILAGALGKG